MPLRGQDVFAASEQLRLGSVLAPRYSDAGGLRWSPTVKSSIQDQDFP